MFEYVSTLEELRDYTCAIWWVNWTTWSSVIVETLMLSRCKINHHLDKSAAMPKAARMLLLAKLRTSCSTQEYFLSSCTTICSDVVESTKSESEFTGSESTDLQFKSL